MSLRRRNATIADKQRDAFVQYAIAWLTSKTRHSPHVTMATSVVLSQGVWELARGSKTVDMFGLTMGHMPDHLQARPSS